MARLQKMTLRLEHIMEDIEWEALQSRTYGSNRMPDDDVRVGFKSSDKNNPDKVDTVEIRLGKEVIEEMGWKSKDKIVVYIDKRKSLNFMLCKTEKGKGYAINQQVGLTTYFLRFRWREDLRLVQRPLSSVDYYIKNNQLIVFSAEVEK